MWEFKRTCFVFLSICVTHSVCQSLLHNSHYDYNGGGGLPDVIKIGGLFDEADPSEETAFKHAVDRVNAERVLPRSRFITQMERLSFGDSYHASTKVCQMMTEGIAAIFGPQSPEAASHVQSICDAFEIPHIETKWDYKIRKENYLINLYPHPMTLSRAYNDLVEAFAWETYVIIYENNERLYTLQDLIKASTPNTRKAVLKQLPEGDDYRSLLKDILYATDIFNIFIDCATDKALEVMKQAQQVGLMTYQYSFIITSLDLHTLDLVDFSYGDINITAYRIVDPERPEVDAIVKQWNSQISVDNYNSRSQIYGQYYGNYGSDQGYMPSARNVAASRNPALPPDNEQRMMKTETALIYDAVFLFGKALHVLDSSQRIDIKPLNCDSKDTWQHGYSIINYMKMVQFQGLTGLIQFNTSGYRTDVQMDVVQLKQNGLRKIGTWDSKFVTKFNWAKQNATEETAQDDSIDLKNRTLTVTTIMNKPFMMLKISTDPLAGNDQFEGYTVDLLNELSKELGFKYNIKLVTDGAYGSLNPETDEWNGMIREVIDGVADIAVADLSVNKDRQKALDFTMPFMNLGISILYVEPKYKAPELFSFMNPFAVDVWMYMFYAFFGVSIVLFIIARVSPMEWDCPHPCIEDPDELENQFTLLNSFWFTIGSLMQQGSDIAPKATSTRMIAGIWWFFTLIMVSSYTANLASFLLVQLKDEPIKSLQDLQNQDVVKYGCVGSGSTASFFRDSPFPERVEMWNNMLEWDKRTPGILPKKNAEGRDKVLKDEGKYAFFMESTVIEYNVERVCGLYQVGNLLDSKGYGVGMRKNSPYRQYFNGGILTLQENGILDKLKRKWWKEERKGTGCAADGGAGAVTPLRIANVGGVFVVLVGGCAVAIIFAFVEFFWENRKIATEEGGTVVEEMSKELKFALSCSSNTKPVKKEKKDSLSSEQGNGEPQDSNQYLDLGLDSYGFPNAPPRANGGINQDGYT
ncbi:unnamed protein product [Orchesella dallaii]|uniref:Glutamate receptor ionotropic, kainate 2 n=1 Tax=Orchesella dallaii TaxID=48710 RepID=A0ABP1QPM4_9HEXA